jgi:ribosomal protein S18 acetylase RimI-like enzyme
MNALVEYRLNTATKREIVVHLQTCDADFVPALSDRVEIGDYAQKIANKATRFEAWSGGTLVGLVAAYCNDRQTCIAHITSVSVLKEWTGKGIAAELMDQCLAYANSQRMRQIGLEVASNNTSAIKLYEKRGFVAGETDAPFVAMSLCLKHWGEHD